jgi:hypothetical protein
MKPLLRWTIGGSISHVGFDILVESVKRLTNLYGDVFDYIICYNNINLDIIKKLGIPLFNQEEFRDSLPWCPSGVAWKLYPPRLRKESHEIFIDNDLVIRYKLWQIDEFLSKDNAVIYTAGLYRSFGRFDKKVARSHKLNSGLFGLPPGFDFYSKLVRLMKAFPLQQAWCDKFDEQGMVASILTSNFDRIVIGLGDIAICHNGNCPFSNYGHHFVSANVGNGYAWEKWKKVYGSAFVDSL